MQSPFTKCLCTALPCECQGRGDLEPRVPPERGGRASAFWWSAPGPGRFGSFFHCFLSWLREVCRCHILKSDPQNQLHPAVLLLRTCGLKFYDQISLSFKCLHWTGSKTLHGWVCSLMCHSGSHGWLFLWPHQPSVGVPWNSKVPWTEKRLE